VCVDGHAWRDVARSVRSDALAPTGLHRVVTFRNVALTGTPVASATARTRPGRSHHCDLRRDLAIEVLEPVCRARLLGAAAGAALLLVVRVGASSLRPPLTARTTATEWD